MDVKDLKKLISVNQISYHYPIPEEENEDNSGSDIYALSKVDLEVEEGQFICILGSNGSGKSTLARHLNALLVPDEGTVWIDGMDTREESHLWDVRSRIGMVFQNPDNQMIASLVDEEVAFGMENLGVPPEEMQARVREALRMVGMSAHEKSNPANLSGGQKQRIAVAGILAMKPKCIVLDESTAMLDPRGRKEIMDTVRQLNREHHITLICITHYMEEAMEADRIFVMKQGKVLMSGTAAEIFSREDEIVQAGLRLPVICQLADELRQRGIAVPRDVITARQLMAALTGNSGKDLKE